MPLFGRPAKNDPDDGLSELRRAIQSRGQAKISEAGSVVGGYLSDIARQAGVSGQPEALAWLRDRLRLLMVLSWSNWFKVLDRIPESTQLRAEWQALTTDAARFGPEHLMAWWWHLSEPFFRPLVDNQLVEMRGALADGARDIREKGTRFADEMVDWSSFFD